MMEVGIVFAGGGGNAGEGIEALVPVGGRGRETL